MADLTLSDGVPDHWRGHAAMLLFSALIAGSFAIGSKAATLIEPAALQAARFCLAGALIGALALAGGRLGGAFFHKPWRWLILGGLFVIYFVTMFEALKTVSAVSISAVFTLTPFLAALIGWAALGQHFGLRMGVALTLGAMGALWIIFRGDMNALLSFDLGRGEAIFLIGVVAHAIYPNAARALTRGDHPLTVNTGMLAAGLILLVLYGWGDIRATDWLHLPGIVWITLFYTSIITGAGTFSLLLYGSNRLPAGKVMAYNYLVPVWVVIWQLALGDPTAPLWVMAGVVLIVTALLLLLRDDGADAKDG